MKEPQEFVVFQGSSDEDVNHAKSFWKSLTLHPPLESRLVSADIRQRLPVASAPGKQSKQSKSSMKNKSIASDAQERFFLHNAYQQKQNDETERYKTISQQRESVLNLLHEQRMERLQKELVSLPYKPNKSKMKLESHSKTNK